ncbi:MAG: PIN domain-containing protein [Candidatus Dormibacteraceae bacterium]
MAHLTLDAYAVIAFVAGEAAGAIVEAQLRDPDRRPQLNAVNLAEVVHRMANRGYPEAAVQERLQDLIDLGVEVVPTDQRLGRLAGALRDRHYNKRRSAVSLADCIALATAKATDASLATADPALLAAAGLEGVDVLVLPDATGRLPDVPS